MTSKQSALSFPHTKHRFGLDVEVWFYADMQGYSALLSEYGLMASKLSVGITPVVPFTQVRGIDAEPIHSRVLEQSSNQLPRILAYQCNAVGNVSLRRDLQL